MSLKSCGAHCQRDFRFVMCFVWVLFLSHLLVHGQTGQNAQPDKKHSSGAMQYFPAGAFDSTSKARSDLFVRGYANLLWSISEPSLLEVAHNASTTSYRIIRSNFPAANDVVVRIEIHTDGTATVWTKVKRIHGPMIMDESFAIAGSDVIQFLEVVRRTRYWSMEESEPVDPNHAVKDGSAWVVEGADDGQYHLVYRVNPKSGPFTELGRYLARELGKTPEAYFRDAR